MVTLSTKITFLASNASRTLQHGGPARREKSVFRVYCAERRPKRTHSALGLMAFSFGIKCNKSGFQSHPIRVGWIRIFDANSSVNSYVLFLGIRVENPDSSDTNRMRFSSCTKKMNSFFHCVEFDNFATIQRSAEWPFFASSVSFRFYRFIS